MVRSPSLSNRSLLLGKIETTYNVDSVPTSAADAFLVMNADLKINPNVLKREFYRPSLSPLPHDLGRKLAVCSFTHEVKGSGIAATESKLGVLLRACGFALTTIANTAAGIIQNPIVNSTNSGPVITWTKFTAATQGFGRYKLKVALGGASATAKLLVFGNPNEGDDLTILPEDDFSCTVMGLPATTTVAVDLTNPIIPAYTIATPQIGDILVFVIGGFRYKYTVASAVAATEATAVAAALTALADSRFTAAAVSGAVNVTLQGATLTGAITSGTTAVNLGSSGAQVKLTWAASLVLNDSWLIDLLKPGMHYTPVSTGHQSMTQYMFYDGMMHKITGCIGTVQFTGPAGNYASAQFSFTGQYVDPIDQPLPTSPVFEATKPLQVELAALRIGNAKLVKAQQVTVDMAITVNPRESVSHSDGYNGVLYSSRAPKGTANPEMAFESEEPYWKNMASSKVLEMFMRIGSVTNNKVDFVSRSIQLEGITYADRNNLRVQDLAFGFVSDQFAGDDEIRIVFS